MKTILVVDDDPHVRKILQTILSQSGEYHVVMAQDGASALQQARRFEVEAVILDINLPT